MKVTKQQLKKIIKEELASVSERVTPEGMEALNKANAIKDILDDAMEDGRIAHYRGLELISKIRDILDSPV
jgi:urease gamma subunit